MGILTIKNISKKFPAQSIPAINYLSLEIQQGEIICFMGENGAGKSTLFKAIAGSIQLDAGDIFFKNVRLKGPLEQLIAGHKEIKFLNQESKLSPNRTVLENIQYELRAYSKEYVIERSQQLLALCEVEFLKDKYSEEISGGQRQRAALAVALASEPSIIILDEPFSEADIFQKKRLKANLLTLLQETATTCLFSTHEPSEALSLPLRIVIMKGGELIQTGTPWELYNQPRSPYVAKLLGNINIFPKKFIKGIIIPSDISVLGIRIENLFTVEKKNSLFSGIVKKIHYYGFYYEVEAAIQNNFSLIYNTGSTVDINKVVHLNCKKNNIVMFRDNEM